MQELFQQLANGIAWGSIYALIALGYTMVYGILRLINFAHGDIYMVGAFTAYFAARALGAGGASPSPAYAVVVLLAAMAACALLGVLIEFFAYRPVRRSSQLTALITAIVSAMTGFQKPKSCLAAITVRIVPSISTPKMMK